MKKDKQWIKFFEDGFRCLRGNKVIYEYFKEY